MRDDFIESLHRSSDIYGCNILRIVYVTKTILRGPSSNNI